MKFAPTDVGCVEVQPLVFTDERGDFVKTFQQSAFGRESLGSRFPEHFFSRSSRGVVRGLHFQAPPLDQDKLVVCVSGAVFDVVVDVRRGSPTYGEFACFDLDDRDWKALYIPKGFAHGFAALQDATVMAYFVSEEFDPALDGGIRWDSLPIPWPVEAPVVSEKDRGLPAFADFDSPWSYEA